jgi:hypothetical protein
MDVGDVIQKLLGLLGQSAEDTVPQSQLQKFATGNIKLRRYYEYWQGQIQKAVSQNQVVSNGWAFSTLNGLASFESYVHGTAEMQALYVNKVGVIDELTESLKAVCGNLKTYGAIVYGYGNLVREAQWLESLVKQQIVSKKDRVYLVDCSLFYHVFALSHMNPVREHILERRIKPVLMDCFNEPNISDLKYKRDDLNAALPTCHILLGNSFGNVSTLCMKTLLDATVRPLDFVIAEYAEYAMQDLQSTKLDYVSQMACRAAAEMFTCLESDVSVKNVFKNSQRLTEVTVKRSGGNTPLVFESMMRRAFNSNELTGSGYDLIASKTIASTNVKVDVFRRTA